jgi:hydroxypyruvate isomerase
MSEIASFPFAVCAEMMFRDLPVIERVKRLDALGFQVEIWDWTKHDINALKATGAIFSSMTGYVTGALSSTEGADELLRTAELSIPVAKKLGIPRLNVHGTGLDGKGSAAQTCLHADGWYVARGVANIGAPSRSREAT